MEYSNLINDNTWDSYSQKMKDRMASLSNAGKISHKQAEELGGKLVIANIGKQSDAESITLYWVVNEEADAIMASKFQSFGSMTTLVSADVLAGLALGKTLYKIIRISDSDIEAVLRDDAETPALPLDKMDSLALVTDVAKEAVAQHAGPELIQELEEEIAVKEAAKPKIESKELIDIDEDLTFAEMTLAQKIQTVNVTLDENVRHMLVMDGGDVEIIDIREDSIGINIYIRYLGNCSGCATGDTGTLFAIETELKTKLDPAITVIPM